MASMTPEDAAAAAQAAADTAKSAAQTAGEAATAAQGFADQAADAIGGAVHAATGGAIDPFVFRLAIFVPTPLARVTMVTSPPAQAARKSSVESAESTASAILLPTP